MSLFCPLHRLPLLMADGGECHACEQAGLKVVACELDKVERIRGTLTQEGYKHDWQRSYAVLVFKKSDYQDIG